MGQFSMEIRTLTGSVLGGNQQHVLSAVNKSGNLLLIASSYRLASTAFEPVSLWILFKQQSLMQKGGRGYLFPSIHFDMSALLRKHSFGTVRRLIRASFSAKATCFEVGN